MSSKSVSKKNVSRKNSEQKTIVVLGVHRGGTSLVAGILRILGVNMGSILKKADRFNQRGYFEDVDFLNLNIKILKRIGGDWNNLPIVNRLDPCNNEFDEQIKQLLKKRGGIWGWKDPRTSITINLYLPYLIKPHFVVCFRNPYDVAESLAEGGGLDFVQGLEVANLYYEHITSFIKQNPNLPRIFINYQNIIDNPVVETERLSKFLALSLDRKKRHKINKFVLPVEKVTNERLRVQRVKEWELENKLAMYKHLNKDIQKSLSWRLTKPLRFSKAFLKKVLR